MASSTQLWPAKPAATCFARNLLKTAAASSFALLIALTGALAYGQTRLASMDIIEPNESFTPQQVIQIIVDSLKYNDAENDAGIATVFRFASKANRLSTGPLERFEAMIKKGFPDMLNHSDARYGAMEISGNTAIQAVWLMTHSGKEIGYAFQLSKQSDGQNANMWMTDRVIPLGVGKDSGLRI